MLYSLAHSKKTKEKGFSLLEVLIAIVILTFGILAVGSMQVSSIQGNFHAGTITEAKTIAGDRLEKLRATQYDLLTAASDPAPPPGYFVAWNADANNPLNNTTTVTVTVTWGWGWGRRDLTISEVIPQGLV